MLEPGRIPLTKAEEQAINELLENHDGNATLTRRDPGETGPVLAQLGTGTFEISADGTVTKVEG